MKKTIVILLAGMIAFASIPFVLSEDRINIKVFFIYPNGKIVEQDVETGSYSVDFTIDNLRICNDLLYMIEEVYSDCPNVEEKLDLAQHHIDLANTTGDFNEELEKAIVILRNILFNEE